MIIVKFLIGLVMIVGFIGIIYFAGVIHGKIFKKQHDFNEKMIYGALSIAVMGLVFELSLLAYGLGESLLKTITE